MFKVVLINGACGVGKSTISKIFHQKIEYSILWEKDLQRRNVAQYKASDAHYKKSASIALQMTHSMIECCAKNKLDLVYDGVLSRKNEVIDLEKKVLSLGGSFYHIYLNAPLDIWLKRLRTRGIAGSLTEEKAIYFYDTLSKMKSEIDMYEIDTSINTLDEVVEIICQHIGIQ